MNLRKAVLVSANGFSANEIAFKASQICEKIENGHNVTQMAKYMDSCGIVGDTKHNNCYKTQ
jgi:hypothetical protein